MKHPFVVVVNLASAQKNSVTSLEDHLGVPYHEIGHQIGRN